MPAVAGSSRRAGGRRRTMNEINMVPFIDVMLVLLIIFMVSAPLITTGVVDLPTVGASRQRPEHVIELVVAADERVQLKLDGRADPVAVAAAARDAAPGDAALRALVERVREAQGDDASIPVVISADRGVKYESVVRVMDGLQRAGVQRVGLSVKSSGA